MSMPNYLVRFPVMCDSVNASAEDVGRQDRLFPSGVIHLEGLVVIEEIRRLLAILECHHIVKIIILAIGIDCYDLGA